MTFTHSTIVDPSTYETQGLCEGIDVRVSKYSHLEDRGAIRSHEDWNKHVAPCHEYRGTLGPRFNFISVTIPECIPERLEIISYANDFAFLHDGMASPALLPLSACRCAHAGPPKLTLNTDHIDDKDFEKVCTVQDMPSFPEMAAPV